MTNVLPQNALRRLQRYRGRLEGAQMGLQNQETLARTLAEQYEQALRSACEDHDVELPREGVQARVDIDWATGAVTWAVQEENRVLMKLPEQMNGQASEPVYPYQQNEQGVGGGGT